MRRTVLFTSLIVWMPFLVLPAFAVPFSSVDVDQEQLIVDTSVGGLVIGSKTDIGNPEDLGQQLAQVVTTGMSGLLTTIRMPISGSGSITLNILGVSGGIPNSTVLASEMFSVPSTSLGTFSSFALSTPLAFSVGDQFAIAVSSASPCCRAWAQGPVGNPYAGGNAFVMNSDSVVPGWQPLCCSPFRMDLPFQTLVGTPVGNRVPIPSTLPLFGMGFVILAAWQQRGKAQAQVG